jgi:hypothetical protein
MKYFGSLGTFIILMSSLLLLTKAWSSEMASKHLLQGNPLGVEAIVIKVEQDTLTLRPTNSNNPEFSIPHKDDGTLHIGDRVVMEENSLRKLGDVSSQGAQPKDVKEGAGAENAPQQSSVPSGPLPDKGSP